MVSFTAIGLMYDLINYLNTDTPKYETDFKNSSMNVGNHLKMVASRLYDDTSKLQFKVLLEHFMNEIIVCETRILTDKGTFKVFKLKKYLKERIKNIELFYNLDENNVDEHYNRVVREFELMEDLTLHGANK